MGAAAHTVLSIVSNDAALEAVVHGERGLLSGMRPGAVHVGCSTVSPHTSRRVAAAHAAAGHAYVSSPVFARPDGIASRTATFVVSGPRQHVDAVKPLLQLTSSAVYEFGEDPGAANVVKLCGNYLIAASIQSIAESMALAESNGVDRAAVMSMLSDTIFNCLIFRGYGHRVAHRNHKAGGFSLDLGLKDVSL